MSEFQLVTRFEPAGDQPEAIRQLVEGIDAGLAHQTLLGVTGSGKTFSIANVISQIKRPTLVLAPNKTLAAQLYGEFKAFFPNNAVEYFVSYYDYYQPEAYVPSSDTFIEKDASINDHIEQMRLSATKALLERKDAIIVTTVSCIYGLGSPETYLRMVLHVDRGDKLDQRALLRRLADLQYTRNDMDFARATFRVRGDVIDIYPAESDLEAIRIELFDDEVESLSAFDPLTGEVIRKLPRFTFYPKSHYVTPRETLVEAMEGIKVELQERLEYLRSQNKLVEAQRLEQRTRFDLEMMLELGYCNGIENYSRYLSAVRPVRRRRPCSTTCRLTPCWSSTSPTSACRRSARCTKATVHARKPWSSMVFVCHRRWTTGPCASTSGKRSARRPSLFRRRRATMKRNMRAALSSRWCARPVWSTRRSKSARR